MTYLLSILTTLTIVVSAFNVGTVLDIKNNVDEKITTISLGSLSPLPGPTVEGTSTAGWTDDGSVVRLNTQSDNVGIGTLNPAMKLQVQGNTYLTGNLDISGGTLIFSNGSASTTLSSNTNGIGISTTAPATLFSVAGQIYANATVTTGVLNVASSTTNIRGIPYVWPTAQGSANQILKNDGTGILSWSADVTGVANFSSSTASLATTTVNWDGTATKRLILTANTDIDFRGGATGTPYDLILEQDGTGSRTFNLLDGINYNALKKAAFSGSARQKQLFRFVYDGHSYTTATTTDSLPFSLYTTITQVGAASDDNFGRVTQTGNQGNRSTTSFYLTNPFRVHAVEVRLAKSGSPADNAVISVYSNSVGNPGTDLASSTVSGSTVTTSCATYYMELNNSVDIAATTTMWIVYSRSGSNSDTDYYLACGDAGADDPRSTVKLEQSSSWVTRTQDLNYSLYGIFKQ